MYRYLYTCGWSPIFGHETCNNNNNSNNYYYYKLTRYLWLKKKIFLKLNEENNYNDSKNM